MEGEELNTTRSAGNDFAVRAAVARAHDTARACRLACAIGHRTRQESMTPRLRFSCDLAVARPPVKVAFANTHLIFGVLLEQHEHKQKLNTPKWPPKQHFLVAFGCTKKNPKSPF